MFPEYYETARLHMRRSDPQLAGSIAAYFRRNRELLRLTEPIWPEGFATAKYQRRLLEQICARQATGMEARYWIFRKEERARVIGMVSLNNIIRGGFLSAMVSYRSDLEELRNGHIAEALGGLAEIAFTEGGLHRLEANIMPRNIASLSVVRKLGFENEGLSPKYLLINGVWEDHVHMVLRNRRME